MALFYTEDLPCLWSGHINPTWSIRVKFTIGSIADPNQLVVGSLILWSHRAPVGQWRMEGLMNMIQPSEIKIKTTIIAKLTFVKNKTIRLIYKFLKYNIFLCTIIFVFNEKKITCL